MDALASSRLAEIEAVRAQLWEAGYRPLAVYSHDHADRLRAGKAPLGNEWTARARRDPPEVVAMPAVSRAVNTGILTDGLRAVDIDVDDPELAGAIRALAIEVLGDAPLRFRVNSGRCLLLFRAAVGSPPKRVLAGKLGKIEVLGNGQQFVAHGRHPTGAALCWYPDPPELVTRDNLPAITEEQINAFFAKVAPQIEAEVRSASRTGTTARIHRQMMREQRPVHLTSLLLLPPSPMTARPTGSIGIASGWRHGLRPRAASMASMPGALGQRSIPSMTLRRAARGGTIIHHHRPTGQVLASSTGWLRRRSHIGSGRVRYAARPRGLIEAPKSSVGPFQRSAPPTSHRASGPMAASYYLAALL